MKINPFDNNYFLGYITEVSPQYVKVHFPSSVLLNRFIFSGEDFQGGLVGNFVAIEGESHGFIGKILELLLPENERLQISEKAFQNSDFHPVGKVEILLSFDFFDPSKISKGLDCFPYVGSKVFVCSSSFIQQYLRKFGVKQDDDETCPTFNLAVLTSNKNTTVEVSQQALFSRHCVVVGTTGGGKSWTVAKLIEESITSNGKSILLDATGEYHTFNKCDGVTSACIGSDSFFHYSKLMVDDLFFLLKPSEKIQTPKLMEAIRSLKIAELVNSDASIKTIDRNGKDLRSQIEDGLLTKIGNDKRPYNEFYFRNISKLENGILDFDISKLNSQIINECVFDNGTTWGGKTENDLSYCVSLISRINSLINTNVFQNIFGFNKKMNDDTELTKIIDNFLNCTEKKLLRIGFENVSYDFQAREILANAIGGFLLNYARKDKFKERPIVFFIDEAHQYLNKDISDEYYTSRPLDSFSQIAKECRKYGLFLCLATQMPRDIPIGTLSQMGTFILHRLINYQDKEAVSNACSSANKGILSFLPVLGEGEAILMGIDFPMPISLKINKPSFQPDSNTPKFKK